MIKEIPAPIPLFEKNNSIAINPDKIEADRKK
jgi:hypothetical protein